jgi:hypothetical protein
VRTHTCKHCHTSVEYPSPWPLPQQRRLPTFMCVALQSRPLQRRRPTTTTYVHHEGVSSPFRLFALADHELANVREMTTSIAIGWNHRIQVQYGRYRRSSTSAMVERRVTKAPWLEGSVDTHITRSQGAVFLRAGSCEGNNVGAPFTVLINIQLRML